jgi:hypothetical protein
LEFDRHLGSHKHVINIIMWFRDMGYYSFVAGFPHQRPTQGHINVVAGGYAIGAPETSS